MLFNHFKNEYLLKQIRLALFATLAESLGLNFKQNKENELFAKYLGFPSNNHYKAALKSLGSAIQYKETLSYSESLEALTASLVDLVEGNLSTSLTDEQNSQITALFITRLTQSKSSKLIPFSKTFVDDLNQLTTFSRVRELGNSIGNVTDSLVPEPHLPTSAYNLISSRFGTDDITKHRTVVVKEQLEQDILDNPFIVGCVESNQRTVIVSPKSLVFNWVKLIKEELPTKDCRGIQSSKDFTSFDADVTVLSIDLFKRLDLSNHDLSNHTVVHTSLDLSQNREVHKKQSRNFNRFGKSIYISHLTSLYRSLNDTDMGTFMGLIDTVRTDSWRIDIANGNLDNIVKKKDMELKYRMIEHLFDGI
ncbi:hypothetical protein [Vibrio alginolyticus]|uniref:hypothetical protein n=1 Tax=Vibrio alginolyticus TaxID=663 RepID=UPI0006CA7B68|nr:hypothetical protein [Vibrio alginolyticus]KPM98361.1 hypothetical protein AOG25_07900 [Vibrio alginolyticus]